MILTKEQLFLKAQTQLSVIFRLVSESSEKGLRLDEMERKLFSELLAMGRTLLESFVVAQGDGNIGEEVDREGHCLRRSRDLRGRRYLSIFGELTIERFVDAVREGQKVEYAPLDQRKRTDAARAGLGCGGGAAGAKPGG